MEKSNPKNKLVLKEGKDKPAFTKRFSLIENGYIDWKGNGTVHLRNKEEVTNVK